MRIKTLILSLFLCAAIVPAIKAEAVQEVTLTVSSDGPTKEEATKNALRSAIEQAFGTFVSANTTILNDELVKDEIVTVSNGSIKDYKEISAVQTDNGNHIVTLSATVSLPNLITYAKSHGSECEFAGNTFGMEMKLFELQKENELKALYNLTEQIIALSRNVMKFDLEIGEPRQPTPNDLPTYYMFDAIKEYFKDSIGYKRFSASPWEVILEPREDFPETGWLKGTLNQKAAAYLRQFHNENDMISKFYVLPITITWRYDINSETSIYETMNSVFSKLALRKSDVENYESKGLKLTELRIGKALDGYEDGRYYFRNSYEDIYGWYYDLFYKLKKESNSFVIKDNTGGESSFYPQEIEKRTFNFDNGVERKDLSVREFRPNMYYDDCTLMISNLGAGGVFRG